MNSFSKNINDTRISVTGENNITSEELKKVIEDAVKDAFDKHKKEIDEEVEALKWIPMEEVFRMMSTGETKFPKQDRNVNYEQIFDNVRNVYLEKNPQVKKERE